MCLTAFAAQAIEVKDVPNVHVADRNRYVSNPDGVLSETAVANLDHSLADIWKQTTAEPVVVVIEKLPDGSTIDSFATELFELWGIGKKDKDNGVLMVVARSDRKAVIRTGYGIEEFLPDIIAGRILRNEMFPKFKEEDYDGGVTAGVDAIAKVLTDPEYADSLRSAHANDAGSDEEDPSFFEVFLGLGVLLSVISLFMYVYTLKKYRRCDVPERWRRLDEIKMPILFFSFFSLGLAALVYLPLIWTMKRMRNRPRQCVNCHAAMNKIDEVNDNRYLTPAQDAEERLKSIDYDVWVCPVCNEIEVLPFVNRASSYTVCERCGARASELSMDRVVVKPTTRSAGRGEKTFVCRHCGGVRKKSYSIAKLASPVVVVGGVGGHGGGGGGFSGGSFGGGFTGGGGASGGW